MSDLANFGTNFHVRFCNFLAKSCTFAKEVVGRHGKMCQLLQLAPQTSTADHLQGGYPLDPKCQK